MDNSTGTSRPPELNKNYQVWSGNVRAHLALRDIFPDQLLPPPYHSAEHARADQLLHSLLIIYAGPAHTRMLQQHNSGKRAWDALAAMHTQSQPLRLMMLNDKLAKLKKEPAEPILDYVQRAQQLQVDLIEAGQLTVDSRIITAIMRGLPAEYKMDCAILRSMAPFQPLTYTTVLSRLQELELDPSRADDESGGTDHHAMYANQPRPSPGRGNNGNRAGRGTNGGRGGRYGDNNGGHIGHHGGKKVCSFCHKDGHWERDCTKKREIVEDLRRSNSYKCM